MKKLSVFILTILLCLGLVACKQQPAEQLTAENIDQYLSFDLKRSEITTWSLYDGAAGTTKTGFSSCTLTLTVSAKQELEMEGGVITFNLFPNNEVFKSVVDQTLELSADGTAVWTYVYEDKQEADLPAFSLNVESVAGSFTVK